MKVLIVEDDDAVRDSLSLLVTSWGYQVTAYGSGEEFLASWRPADGHCVLLDLDLPGINGVEVLERTRGLSDDMKVIVITGGFSQDLENRARGLGALDVLRKPVAESVLQKLVTDAVA